MNEAVVINTGDTVKDIVKSLNDNLSYMQKAINNATDEEYNVINKVLAWEDTSKSIGLAIWDLAKLFDYEKDIGYEE